MLFSKNHLPVNWVDGMKLSQQHFVDTDHQIQDLVRDATSLFLTDYNYGLLPVKGTLVDHDFTLLEKNSSHVEIRLYRCNAITHGGCRIAINPDILKVTVLTASFEVPVHTTNQAYPGYDIVLVVDPFKKVPVGNPDPDESPLRHPYTDYAYQLMVVSSLHVNPDELGQHQLIIGKAIYQEGHYVIDSHYIPPCATVASHPRLVHYYKDFSLGLNDIQINSFKIIRKVVNQQQPSDIARHVQVLCQRILDYLGTVFFQFRNMDYQHPPIFMVGYFANLTSIIYTNLYYLPGQQKEELLNYFFEWTEVRPGHFEDLLLQLLEHDYKHHQIGVSMDAIDQFLTVFTRLWKKLSTLEYIGQRRETILVHEEAPIQIAPTRRGWNILD